MTHAAKTGAPREVLLGKVMTVHTGRVGGERSNLYLLRSHPMANIAGYFGVLVSLMIERRALPRSLRAAGLRPSGLRPL